VTKTNQLQDLLLSRVRRDKLPVTLFLMNGFQMRGLVTGCDLFTVVLTTDGKQQMIYKHAISTIIPERPVDLSSEEDNFPPQKTGRSPTETRFAGG